MASNRGIANSLLTEFVASDEECAEQRRSFRAESDMDDPFITRIRALWKKDLEDAKKEMERAHRQEIARIEATCREQAEELEKTKSALQNYMEKEKNWEEKTKKLVDENAKLKAQINDLMAKKKRSNLRRRRHQEPLTPEEQALEFTDSPEAKLLQSEAEKLPQSKKWGWKAIVGAIVVITITAGLVAAGGAGIPLLAIEGSALLTAGLAGAGGAVGAATAACCCLAVAEASNKTKR